MPCDCVSRRLGEGPQISRGADHVPRPRPSDRRNPDPYPSRVLSNRWRPPAPSSTATTPPEPPRSRPRHEASRDREILPYARLGQQRPACPDDPKQEDRRGTGPDAPLKYAGRDPARLRRPGGRAAFMRWMPFIDALRPWPRPPEANRPITAAAGSWRRSPTLETPDPCGWIRGADRIHTRSRP